MSAIVKPSLEDQDDRKAGMPDYQNVEKKIAAIPAASVLFAFFIVDTVNKDYTYINDF